MIASKSGHAPRKPRGFCREAPQHVADIFEDVANAFERIGDVLVVLKQTLDEAEQHQIGLEVDLRCARQLLERRAAARVASTQPPKLGGQPVTRLGQLANISVERIDACVHVHFHNDSSMSRGPESPDDNTVEASGRPGCDSGPDGCEGAS